MLTRRQFATRGLTLTAAATAALASGVVISSTACSTSWIEVAVQDLPKISDILTTVLSLVTLADPGLSTAVVETIKIAVTTAQGALTTIAALIQSYSSQPSSTVIQKIDAALTSVQQNLSGILAAGHIDNAALQATISVGISLAIVVVQGIQALIPASSAAGLTSSLSPKVLRAGVKSRLSTDVKLLTADQIQASFNVVLVAAGYSTHQI